MQLPREPPGLVYDVPEGMCQDNRNKKFLDAQRYSVIRLRCFLPRRYDF